MYRFTFSIILVLIALATKAQETDASKLYNEAIIAYKQDDMGTAVYNLELAQLIKPYDQEIAHNLRLAKAKVAVDVVELDGFFLSEWLHGAAGSLSPGTWKYITILLLIAILFLMYSKLIKDKQGKLFSWATISILGLLVVISVLLGSTRERQLHQGKYAIVMSPESNSLKEGPDEVSEDIKPVSPGVKLEIIDESQDWYKVLAMDKEQGWIEMSAVQIISLK